MFTPDEIIERYIPQPKPKPEPTYIEAGEGIKSSSGVITIPNYLDHAKWNEGISKMIGSSGGGGSPPDSNFITKLEVDVITSMEFLGKQITLSTYVNGKKYNVAHRISMDEIRSFKGTQIIPTILRPLTEKLVELIMDNTLKADFIKQITANDTLPL
jgi:hypothetical protein